MEIKNEHMEKLERAFFENLMRDNCEYGGIGLDDKRPFGNSSVEPDILEIIGMEPANHCKDCGDSYSDEQYEYANDLYDNLIPWLQKKYL